MLLPLVPQPTSPSAVQDYLPPVLHATFLAAVTEFVWLPWKEAVGGEGAGLEGATQGGSQVRAASNQGMHR